MFAHSTRFKRRDGSTPDSTGVRFKTRAAMAPSLFVEQPHPPRFGERLDFPARLARGGQPDVARRAGLKPADVLRHE
jgi:hypothetical protein